MSKPVPSAADASDYWSPEKFLERKQAARAKRKAIEREKLKTHPPTKRLPRELNLWLGAKSPHLLWYGIGFNHQHLAAYAKKVGIWPDDDVSYEEKLTVADICSVPIFQRATGWPHLEIRVPYSKPYQRIIGIYSSYWAFERMLSPEDEAELVRRIEEEFEIQGELLWYYDRRVCDHEYLGVFPERYAREYRRQLQEHNAAKESGVTTDPIPENHRLLETD